MPEAMTAAASYLNCSSWATISSGRISVFIGRLPEMKTTEPYSPIARAKARVKPVISAGTSSGKITRRKVGPAVRAEAGGGFLDFRAEILHHRLQRCARRTGGR